MQAEFAAACNLVVPFARDNRCWNRVALHHLAYYKVRETSPLGSQMICNAIKSVADAYKVLKLRKADEVPTVAFRPTGSVHFDARTFSLKGNTVSLYTLEGRIKAKCILGEFQTDYLAAGKPKEAELIRKGRQWFLNLVLDLPDAPPISGGKIGVDVGENNLAASSTGKVWGGGQLRHHRDIYLAHRRRLQSNGSRAAKRKLKAISGREQRHVRHVNHETSKAIITEAISSGAGEIRMEDLTHIRANIKAGKRIRTRLHRWAFRQLQDFVAYKAEGVGLRVVYVNPAYTSQTCSVCGEIGKRVKHHFACSCGNLAHSDVNASRNIAGFASPIGLARAVVTQPEF
ncbi:MAG: transposase, partial [Thiobacillaceae bacterium]